MTDISISRGALTDDHMTYYRAECSVCQGKFIISYGIENIVNPHASHEINDQLQKLMKIDWAISYQNELFCPYCNSCMTDMQVYKFTRACPEYAKIDGALFRVNEDDEKRKDPFAGIEGEISIHDMANTLVRFYRGNCFECKQDWTYFEVSDPKWENLDDFTRETVLNAMGCKIASKAYNSKSKAKMWECPNCYAFQIPSLKFSSSRRWGGFFPEFGLGKDQKVYRFYDTKEKSRKAVVSVSKKRQWQDSSYDASYSSYSSYGSEDNWHAWESAFKSDKERMDDIKELLDHTHRPRPTSAGLLHKSS